MEPQEIKIDKRSKEYRSMKESGTLPQEQDMNFTDVVSETPEDIIEGHVLDSNLQSETIIEEPQKSTYMDNLNDMLVLPPPITKSPNKTERKRVRSTVSIKPYVSGQPNMGLEKYEEATFPGAIQPDRVFCDTKGNIKTYRTGLNEFAASVQSMTNKVEKEAKIKSIRETVAFLENTANANFLVNKDNCMDGFGTKDDKFWENVTMFKSVCVDKKDAQGDRIPTYWDGIELPLTNEGRVLDLKDPHDLAIYHIIQDNGFGMVANSLQQAISDTGYKFYLHQVEDVAAIKTEFKKLRNKAGAYLEYMLEKDPTELFYMAKLCAPLGSSTYKQGGDAYTPNDQLYEDLCNFIEGKTVEHDSNVAVREFLKNYLLSKHDKKLKCVLKDAIELRLIALKGNGQLYYLKNNDMLGKNIEEAIEHLKNPLYSTTWIDLESVVSTIWAN